MPKIPLPVVDEALYTNELESIDEIHFDEGPWNVSEDGRYIMSDDFHYDVTLKVGGDFASDILRKAYSDELAARLNGFRSTRPTPK